MCCSWEVRQASVDANVNVCVYQNHRSHGIVLVSMLMSCNAMLCSRTTRTASTYTYIYIYVCVCVLDVCELYCADSRCIYLSSSFPEEEQMLLCSLNTPAGAWMISSTRPVLSEMLRCGMQIILSTISSSCCKTHTYTHTHTEMQNVHVRKIEGPMYAEHRYNNDTHV